MIHVRDIQKLLVGMKAGVTQVPKILKKMYNNISTICYVDLYVRCKDTYICVFVFVFAFMYTPYTSIQHVYIRSCSITTQQKTYFQVGTYRGLYY